MVKVKKETTTFQTTCTVEFFERLENFCEINGMSRSKIVRIALEKEMNERENKK